jgi:hypothetical protein
MDFRTAATLLSKQVTTAEIADALGVSPHSIRQARLAPGAPGYRRPPAGWAQALARLAAERSDELQELAQALRSEQIEDPGRSPA